MQSLKTAFPGQIFALAKPHDSVGKRTRNRIPKEERKILVESFIKKHQKLNNGSFPSLSLTHKEVGGSFYTIREIVREIIQENRVLGAGDLILEGKGSEHLQDQSLSVMVDPVPPLSLSPDGFHSASDQNGSFSSEIGKGNSPGNRENIDGSQVGPEERGSNKSDFREVNGNVTQLFEEDVGMLVRQSMDTADISRTQFEASSSEENDAKHYARLHDRAQTICDTSITKPQDKELNVDNKDGKFEGIPLTEPEGTKPVNNEEILNSAGAALTDVVNMTKYSSGTTDLPAETVLETFPVRSVTSTMKLSDVQPSELGKVCEDGKGTEVEVEPESSYITSVDLIEISSSASAVPEEQGTEVNVDQMPNHISALMEKNAEEKIANPAPVDVECADTKRTVVANAVIGNIHETKEFSNGSLTTVQTMPTCGTESGSGKNDIAKVDTMSSLSRNEVTIVENAIVEKKILDASDSSNSQKGNNATLNRIKPESWKEQSNVAGQKTNPLLAVLKSFLTAFVKFWSE